MKLIQLKENKKKLIRARTVSDIGPLFHLGCEDLYEQILNPKYKEFTLKKKNGGERIISIPSKNLKKTQGILAQYLQYIYTDIRPACVHGFARKNIKSPNETGIKGNAFPHIGNAFLLNLDIKDFFGSIKSTSIQNFFETYPFSANKQLSAALTLLCTYQYKLPQGSSTSPVISNFIFLPLDLKIQKLCAEFRIVYTRYADDLSFSSNEPEFKNTALTTFKAEIEKIISTENFKINPSKIFFRTQKQAQKVTGITVNEKLNVSRDFIRNSRAMLYDWKKNGLINASEKHFKEVTIKTDLSHKFTLKLKGRIDFIGMVRGKNDRIYLSLKENFESLIKNLVL